MPKKKPHVPELKDIIISVVVAVVSIFLLLYGLSQLRSFVSCLLSLTQDCPESVKGTVFLTYVIVTLFALWLLWQLKKSRLLEK